MRAPVYSAVAQTSLDRTVVSGGLRIGITSAPGESELSPHAHRQANVLFLLAGELEQRVGRRRYTLSGGRAIEKQAALVHSDRFGPSPSRMLFVEVLPERLDSVREQLGLFRYPATQHDVLPRRLTSDLVVEVSRPHPIPLAVEALALELLVAISTARDLVPRHRPKWLDRALELLEERLDEPPTLGEIARAAGVGGEEASRTFRRFTGGTPLDWVRRRRVEVAAREIARGHPSLAELAVELGFADQPHMTRAFRRVLGTTPPPTVAAAAIERPTVQDARLFGCSNGHQEASMRDFVVQALKKLVSIPSVNPTFAGPRSGPGGEAAIIEYLEWQCESFGLATELIPTPSADRPSLIARLPGSGGGRSLMLNGHVDTVGVETVDEPFEPRVSNGRLYGRGAYDMKGGVAACLAALLELSRRPHPPRGDVWFTAVADEEDASEGARAVARRLSTDGVIVTEPTHLVPTVAHKGFAWVEVHTQGFACHGSRGDRGIDANRRAATVFAALDALETERSSLRHPLLGSPSLHVGRIGGGVGPSIYSPSCRLTIELRTLPDESTDQLVARLAELIEAAAPESSVIASPPEVTLARPPLDGSADGTLASMVADAVERTTGERPSAAGVGYWTDAAVFAETSREVLLLGPSGDGAHEDVEWVDLESVVANARILVDVAKAYCG